MRSPMYRDPYLESCCRSALHRLTLCGPEGRPAGQKDEPCMTRLIGMALVRKRDDGRYEITPSGRGRHSREVLILTRQD